MVSKQIKIISGERGRGAEDREGAEFPVKGNVSYEYVSDEGGGSS